MIVFSADPGDVVGWSLVDLSKPSRPRLILGGTERNIESLRGFFPGMKFDLVAIESVSAMYARERFGIAMANKLLHSARVEESIARIARDSGYKIATCTASEWRTSLIGDASPKDATIKAVLRRRVENVGGNAHVFDAVGVACFCGERERLASMVKRPVLQTEPPMFHRASGDAVCAKCEKPYRKHPLATEPENLGINGAFLRRLCDGGQLVKI